MGSEIQQQDLNKTWRQRIVSYYPWLVIFLALLILFYKYLLQVFPSVITDQLMTTFNLTGTGLGNLAAFFFYSYLVTQLVSGVLIDKFNIRLVITVSLIISALGALLFSMTESFPIAITGRILMGVGAAFATVGYMKTAAIYFSAERFALVGGLLTVGVMLGAVFGEAPLALLIQAVGWHQAIRIVSFVGFAIGILFFIFVRNRPHSATPSSATVTQSFSLQNYYNILKVKTNWYLTLYSGLAFAPLAVFGGLWGTPFIAANYHLSQASAAAYVSVVYVGFGIGGPLFGYLADRLRARFQFMLLGLILSLISILFIIYAQPNPAWLVTLTLLFGLGTGAFMLGFAVGKDLNPIYMAASVIALINSGDALCGALSEPLIGKLLDLNYHGTAISPTHFGVHDYHIAFITLPVELLLAFGFLWLSKRTSHQ